MKSNPLIVLFAEDNEHDIRFIKRAWEKHHINSRLISVRDGEACLDYIYARGVYANRSANDNPQLLLLDIKLPKKDGLAVLQTLRDDKHFYALPIVVFTNSVDLEDITVSYQLGANAFIRKPGTFEEFAHVIKSLCQFWSHVNLPEE